MTNIANSIKRHSTLFILIAATWILVGASKEVTLQTALTVATFEGIAIFLSYLLLYMISPVQWLKALDDEFHKPESERDNAKLYVSAAMVAVALAVVHFVVGVGVFAIYFTLYKPIP